MKDDQSISLSETISSQKNGIILIWSRYDTDNKKSVNADFTFTFVPKAFVNLHNGKGAACPVGRAAFYNIGMKYVYISDDEITGYSKNASSGTSNGITYDNGLFVLRYVIGV